MSKKTDLRYNPMDIDDCWRPIRPDAYHLGPDAWTDQDIPTTFEDELEAMGYEIVEHGLYDHFKGGKYVSLWIGKNSETMEPEVHYMNLTHGTFYSRDISNFTANIERNGKVQRRFQLTQPLPLWRRLLLVLKHARF